MDCNQQRRPQNGCSRPMMNNGQSSMPGCATQGSMNNSRNGSMNSPMNCSNMNNSRNNSVNNSRNHSMQGSWNNSRNNSMPGSGNSRTAMNGGGGGCGCGDSGNTRSNTTEMDSFAVGMTYVPWQRWNQTYDMHRGLSSGTIFPELDKPFCAAGRCGR